MVTALWPASVRCWRVDTLCAHVELTLACVCTRANRTSPSTTHPPNPTELRDIKTRACRALEDRGNTGTLEGAALPVPRASHFINVDNSLSLLPSMGIQCIACLRGVGLACVLGLTSVRLHAARTEHTDVPQPCRLAWVAAPFNATSASLASSFVLDGFWAVPPVRLCTAVMGTSVLHQRLVRVLPRVVGADGGSGQLARNRDVSQSLVVMRDAQQTGDYGDAMPSH